MRRALAPKRVVHRHKRRPIDLKCEFYDEADYVWRQCRLGVVVERLRFCGLPPLAWDTLLELHDSKGELTVRFGCPRSMVDHQAVERAIAEAWEVVNEYAYEICYGRESSEYDD
jgi:hypothetical protein